MKCLPISQPGVRAVLASLLVAALSGCAGMSGFGGGSSLTCKLPDGARCDSVSSTYSESTRGLLPGQRKRAGIDAGSAAPSAAPMRGAPIAVNPQLMPVSMPVRSQPRIVRVWIKPWEDADGDLHDQTYVYLPVDEGRWMVEHKQHEVRQAFAPARSPREMVRLHSQPVAGPSPLSGGSGATAATAVQRPTMPPAAAVQAGTQQAVTPGITNPALASALKRVISERTGGTAPASGKPQGGGNGS